MKPHFTFKMENKNLPILEQTYNFNPELYRLVNNFPKAHTANVLWTFERDKCDGKKE